MKTPKLNFAHLCDNAFLSQDGKLNLIGIFKNLNVKTLPATFPQIMVAVNLILSESSNLKVQIVKKIGMEVISKMEAKIDLTQKKTDNPEIGFIGAFNNVTLKEAGDYLLEVWVGSQILNMSGFTVIEIKKNESNKES